MNKYKLKHCRVELNEWEITVGTLLGRNRYSISRKMNLSDKIPASTPDMDVESMLGEMAVAKYLGIYWCGGINSFKGCDVGPFQVRWTKRPNGRLVCDRNDKIKEPFVLVIGNKGIYFVVGWAWGYEIRRDGEWNSVVPNAWALSQEKLRPVSTLFEESFKWQKKQNELKRSKLSSVKMD